MYSHNVFYMHKMLKFVEHVACLMDAYIATVTIQLNVVLSNRRCRLVTVMNWNTLK